MAKDAGAKGEVPGWVILGPDAVPEGWRARAVPMVLVPLTPAEADRLLSGDPVETTITPEDLRLIQLVAKGLSVVEIARVLSMSTRTTYRRVTRLRDEFAVSTLEELSTVLARRGF